MNNNALITEKSSAELAAAQSKAVKNRIAFASGDGIGPEIMEATLRILEAAGAGFSWDEIAIGQRVYESGQLSGIAP